MSNQLDAYRALGVSSKPIVYSANLARFRERRLPDADPIHRIAKRPRNGDPREIKKLLVVLSTPRSGSKLLAGLCEDAFGFLPHEYFQETGYLQVLARRFGSHRVGRIVKSHYISNLSRRVTSDAGIFAVGVHGSQVDTFLKFANQLSDWPLEVVRLSRTDRIAQATSYARSRTTGVWLTSPSANYSNATNPTTEQIGHALADLLVQELVLDTLCETLSTVKEVSYEKLTDSPLETMSVFGEVTDSHVFERVQRPGTSKTPTNHNQVRQVLLVAQEVLSHRARAPKVLSRLQKLFTRYL